MEKKNTKIDHFDKFNLPDVRSDIDDALIEIGNKYNITLRIGAMSYSEDQFTTKITALIGDDAAAKKLQFEKNAHAFRQFSAEDYNKKFVAADGETYTLIGLNPKAKTNGCVVLDKNGKEYVCPPDFLHTKKQEGRN